MEVKYRTTKAGKAHFRVLGDPAWMSKEEIKKGEELRESMKLEDWAEEQVCTVLGYDNIGLTLDILKECFKEDKIHNEIHVYAYNNLKSIVDKLLAKGYISTS